MYCTVQLGLYSALQYVLYSALQVEGAGAAGVEKVKEVLTAREGVSTKHGIV